VNKSKSTLAILGFAAATAFSGAALAQAEPVRGFYIGGSIGQMEADGNCASGDSCDFKDTSWKLFGGYRFNRYLAAEGFYADLGKISIRRGTVNVSAEQTSIGAAAVGILPLGQHFELFGKLGLASSSRKITGSAPGVAISDNDSGSDILFGIGASYNFTRNFGLRAEWERYNDSEINVMSIGAQYKF
jgi:OmpA-OmpF porin, OOP family